MDAPVTTADARRLFRMIEQAGILASLLSHNSETPAESRQWTDAVLTIAEARDAVGAALVLRTESDQLAAEIESGDRDQDGNVIPYDRCESARSIYA